MNMKHYTAYLLIAASVSTGCTTRYAIHGEMVLNDSAGNTITNSLYCAETKRLLWYDNKADVVWLITKDRPNVRLQFDKVEGIEPLAAEVEPDKVTPVIASAYPANIAGIIENIDSIDHFAPGIAQVSIFTKYKPGWGDLPGINHTYLAPAETPYLFQIERHKLKDNAVPEWVRDAIE